MSKALTKPKWTDGPYKAHRSESTNGWWVMLDSEGDEIGSTDGGFEFAEAHLFAAAPELYEAGACFPTRDDFPNDEDFAVACEVWYQDEMKPILANARGEQSDD